MVIFMLTQIYDEKKLSVNDHTDPEMIEILTKKVFW